MREILRVGAVIAAAVACAASASKQPAKQGTWTPPPPPPKPDCSITSPTSKIESAFGEMAGFSDLEIYSAAIQFLTTTGTEIAERDPITKTFTTRPMVGQTIMTKCEVNLYRSYSLSVAVVGTKLVVNMKCRGSTGWEEHVNSYGVRVSSHRSAVTDCEFITAGDAQLLPNIVEGTRAMLTLKKTP